MLKFLLEFHYDVRVNVVGSHSVSLRFDNCGYGRLADTYPELLSSPDLI